MGLFGKLFGKKEITKPGTDFDTATLTQTSEMLDEELFWNIVGRSLKKSADQDDQEEYLIREIEKLTPAEIIGFRLRTDKLLYDTYTPEMWCAGYIMNSGSSDDSFEYFRNWIISRGKETYYNAKENPDSLIKEVVEDEEYYDFESFWSVANEAFENKTGADLDDYIDYEHFQTHETKYPKIVFNWKEEDPESMRKICPRLFEKLWVQQQ